MAPNTFWKRITIHYGSWCFNTKKLQEHYKEISQKQNMAWTLEKQNSIYTLMVGWEVLMLGRVSQLETAILLLLLKLRFRRVACSLFSWIEARSCITEALWGRWNKRGWEGSVIWEMVLVICLYSILFHVLYPVKRLDKKNKQVRQERKREGEGERERERGEWEREKREGERERKRKKEKEKKRKKDWVKDQKKSIKSKRKKEKLHYQLVSTPQISAALINPRLKASALKSSSLSFIVII